MFNGGERVLEIRDLEKEHLAARSEYQAACRELLRRDRDAPFTRRNAELTRAANVCAAKKRAYQSSTEKLRVARGG